MVKIKVHTVKGNSPLTHSLLPISSLQTIDENTEISVQFESIGERREVTICALIEEGEERSGNWHEELVSKGFVASERTLEFMTNIDTGYVVGYLRSYCRQI